MPPAMIWSPKKRFDAWVTEWRDDWWADLTDPNSRARAQFDMKFFDLGALRALYLNRLQIDDGVWRSSQPSPRQVHDLAAQGIRTIVNLRGPSSWGSYALEKMACDEAGIEFVDHRLQSRDPPTVAAIRGLKEIFETAPRPLLMHCKSGADRAGIASALYILLMTDRPPEKAMRQLSLRFGHVRASKTGVLDFFVQSYLAHHAAHGTGFEDWLDRVYDRPAMQRKFRAGPMASFVTDKIRRELSVVGPKTR